jgi:hypothetical protein
MIHKSTRTSPISAAKNSLRGAVSDKAAKHVQVLSEALQSLPLSEFSRFADWVDWYPAKRVRLYPPPKISKYADLWLGSFLTVNDLATALGWFSAFLTRNLKLIKSFLHHADAYELACLSGSYDAAHEALDQIESELGLSIWLIQARIALLHRSQGLEAQKGYARAIHDAAPRSVPAYIAHYTSWRNEDATSIERYAAHVREDIKQQPAQDGTKAYIQDRLLGSSEMDDTSLCALLCVASSISIIDAYEAYVGTITEVLTRSELTLDRSAAERALSTLDVDDWRLHKLRTTLPKADFSELAARDLSADCALFRGDYAKAIDLALCQARQTPRDVDALAVAATAYALTDTTPASAGISALQAEILNLFTALSENS